MPFSAGPKNIVELRAQELQITTIITTIHKLGENLKAYKA